MPIGPRQLTPKVRGMHASLAEKTVKLPRSDNVGRSIEVRSGLFRSIELPVWLDWRRPAAFSTISIKSPRRGRGDEDHPSFLIQALHPQLIN